MAADDSLATIALLLSGGLDSSILLGHLLNQGRRVQPIFVRSHLVWEREELAAVDRLLIAFRSSRLNPLVTLDLPVRDLYRGHWSVTGEGTPDAKSPDESVFLPGRNGLLLIKASIWCALNGVPELTLAPLGSSPFADASPEFFASFEQTFSYLGLPPIRIVLPFRTFNKRSVMELGREMPLQLSFSCMSPIGGLHCGRCNKCAERQQAFRDVKRPDLTPYANPLDP